MSTGWIVFGLCALTLVGATLPLLHERRSAKKAADRQNLKRD